jgi:hypothetical protein
MCLKLSSHEMKHGFFQYDPEMKTQLMHKLKLKVMMIIFFDNRGIIMIEWVPEGQMVNQKYYLEVLTKL